MNMLFIGHSLIEFFDWQKRFPNHNVSNLGVAGETVEGLLSRIDRIIRENPSPDIIFIMTGLNNIAMDDFGFLGSYKEIITKLSSAYPGTGIYVNSIIPTLLEFIPNESIKDANISIKKLSSDTNVEFLDLYRLFTDENGCPIKNYFLDDGVHLSKKGYEVWAKTLAAIINKLPLFSAHDS